MEHDTDEEKVKTRTNYFKPMWRWLDDVQNDFAARADWCVKDYALANHHPIVRLKNKTLDIKAKAGSKIKLNARPSVDPDGDELSFKWWHYNEADSYKGKDIPSLNDSKVKIIVPKDAQPGETIHLICEVSDLGTPTLTRYRRIIIDIIP